MGTNYYAKFPKVFGTFPSEEDYHIGKSSGGWVFSLHVDEERGINSFNDLLTMLERCDHIINEYGEEIPIQEMVDIIKRSGYTDARPLVKPEIDGFHCVGFDQEGNCSLIIGNFA